MPCHATSVTPLGSKASTDGYPSDRLPPRQHHHQRVVKDQNTSTEETISGQTGIRDSLSTPVTAAIDTPQTTWSQSSTIFNGWIPVACIRSIIIFNGDEGSKQEHKKRSAVRRVDATP